MDVLFLGVDGFDFEAVQEGGSFSSNHEPSELERLSVVVQEHCQR